MTRSNTRSVKRSSTPIFLFSQYQGRVHPKGKSTPSVCDLSVSLFVFLFLVPRHSLSLYSLSKPPHPESEEVPPLLRSTLNFLSFLGVFSSLTPPQTSLRLTYRQTSFLGSICSLTFFRYSTTSSLYPFGLSFFIRPLPPTHGQYRGSGPLLDPKRTHVPLPPW